MKKLIAFSILHTAVLIACFSVAMSEERSLFPVKVDGKWGYINEQGEIAIEPKWRWAQPFHNGHAMVGLWTPPVGYHQPYYAGKGDGCGLIDETGRYVVEPKFESIEGPSEGCFAAQTGGRWDYYDLEGSRLTEQCFDYAWEFENGLGPVKINGGMNTLLDREFNIALALPAGQTVFNFAGGRAIFQDQATGNGFIDREGKVLVPPTIFSAFHWDGTSAISWLSNSGEKLKNSCLIDGEGNSLFKPVDGLITDHNDEACLVKSERLYGFLGLEGDWLAEPQFHLALLPENDRAAVVTSDGRVSMVDSHGNELADTGLKYDRYDLRLERIGELVKVEVESQLCTLDEELNLSELPGVYSVSRVPGDMWIVSSNGPEGMGLLDADQNVRFWTKPQDRLEPPSEGLVSVKARLSITPYGFVDLDGETVIERKFLDAGNFVGGLAPVEDSPGKWGYIDRQGDYVIAPQFERARDFHEGLAAVQTANGWGYIDPEGEFVVAPVWDQAWDFSEGIGRVMDDLKTAYISPRGIVLVQPKWHVGTDFSDGLAAVSPDGFKWGYINKLGVAVIKPQFDYVTSFKDGRAAVGKWPGTNEDRLAPGAPGWKFGLIDKKGTELTGWKYDWIGEFSGGYAPVHISDEMGGYYEYIDRDGSVVTNHHFERANQFRNGHAVAHLPSLVAYVDMDGNVIWPPTY